MDEATSAVDSNRRAQRGTSFIEYALLCAIIVGGCAFAISELQSSVENKLTAIADQLK